MNAFPKVRLAVLFLLGASIPLYGAASEGSADAGEIDPGGPLPAEEGLDFLERLEFRSFTQFSGRMFFGLHDPLENESFTLEAGMVRRGIEIVAFNRAGKVLSVRSGEATREISLAASQILELKEALGPHGSEALGIEEIQRRWREREDERQAFAARWEDAVAESPELAEIEAHAQELFAELSDLRDSLEERPGDRSVRERIAQVGEEFRLLEEYGMGMVADNPTFQPEDMETVDLLRLQVRHAWPEVGEDFSGD